MPKKLTYKTRIIQPYLPEELITEFDNLYPNFRNVFARRCWIRAVKDKNFFDDVYYKTYDPYNNNGMNNPNVDLHKFLKDNNYR